MIMQAKQLSALLDRAKPRMVASLVTSALVHTVVLLAVLAATTQTKKQDHVYAEVTLDTTELTSDTLPTLQDTVSELQKTNHAVSSNANTNVEIKSVIVGETGIDRELKRGRGSAGDVSFQTFYDGTARPLVRFPHIRLPKPQLKNHFTLSFSLVIAPDGILTGTLTQGTASEEVQKIIAPFLNEFRYTPQSTASKAEITFYR